MSMHNTPLTDLEREGLEKHLLAIEYPSQLADVFRQGMAWALSKAQPTPSQSVDEPEENAERELFERA